ncbi:hypothetical protein NDU88_000345 [Pleurodeles waltl]|uniref:Uncharacterized protein n=1 Tax=Pleurodeles waltl TaxID=8319 RepID=A0AAV7L679_PLEWA|nr:hypothetical protein NDU88_000345 [Pleurodeles waltl]
MVRLRRARESTGWRGTAREPGRLMSMDRGIGTLQGAQRAQSSGWLPSSSNPTLVVLAPDSSGNSFQQLGRTVEDASFLLSIAFVCVCFTKLAMLKVPKDTSRVT